MPTGKGEVYKPQAPTINRDRHPQVPFGLKNKFYTDKTSMTRFVSKEHV
jgi:hypothetical protein